jgi:GT2 family glycosyltransferase
MEQPDLTISIVNTNNREMTLQCLESIFASTQRISFEVVVVDNGSTDGSYEAIREQFPRVKLIRNETRLGFSTNHNKALAQAQGRYLMILNDDTLVLPEAFDRLVEFMDEHPQVGATGPKLLNPDGTNQPAFDRFPSPWYEAFRPLSSNLWIRTWDVETPLSVDWVCGACMVVRREAVERVGLLDPQFDPLYAEETDWCFRLKRNGWEVLHVPSAQVIHYGGATMKQIRLEAMTALYVKKKLFLKKHRGPFSAYLFQLLLFLTSVGKLFLWLLRCYAVKVTSDTMAHQKLLTHWYLARQALFL